MSVLDIRRGGEGSSCTAGTLVYSAYTCYHNIHKGEGDIHAPSRIRTHDLSVEAVQDRKHPESRGNCDGLHCTLLNTYLHFKYQRILSSLWRHPTCTISPTGNTHQCVRSLFLNRRAAARYRALASIIPGRERPKETTISYKISFVQLITNLNLILYLSTCHTVYVSVLILFMIMP